MAVRGINECESPRKTRLGRGVRGIVGGERPVYYVFRSNVTRDGAERGVVLVVHEEDGHIRTDGKTETLDRVS